MRRATPRHRLLAPLLALLVAGCGGGGEGQESPTDRPASAPAGGAPVEGVLVVQGHARDADGRPVRRQGVTPEPVAEPVDPARLARRLVREEEPWPAPTLLPDGTIDAGPDPFADDAVAVQPVPIEDDPNATTEIAAAATQLRRIDVERWREWMDADVRSPWQQGPDPELGAIVKVAVERCGGARTMATGVVLDDDTVVTTVHAVESAAERVRVVPAAGGTRLPAMVRYLDVDDDVAVLKVPGLEVEPMRWYAPVDQEPRLAYAYGLVVGGRSGMVRRTPVLTSTRETTIDVEQPDGFGRQVRDRAVQTVVGGIAGGFSGGVISATNDPLLRGGFGFHGIVRARVPFRADTAGIVVPSRIVADALDASQRLEEWFEHRPGDCPQWRRAPRVAN